MNIVAIFLCKQQVEERCIHGSEEKQRVIALRHFGHGRTAIPERSSWVLPCCAAGCRAFPHLVPQQLPKGSGAVNEEKKWRGNWTSAAAVLQLVGKAT